MTAIAPGNDEPYDPDRTDERAYDDRAGDFIEEALERGEFLVDEALSSTNTDYGGRDPAEESLV